MDRPPASAGPARSPLVLADPDGQRMPPRLGVVADEHPFPGGQDHHLGSGARVGDFRIHRLRPGLPAIPGFGTQQPVRRRAIVPHPGHDGTVASDGQARLDVAQPEDGCRRPPGEPPVIGDGHHREGVPVMVQGQQPAPTHDGQVGPGHPAEALVEAVGGPEPDALDEAGDLLALLRVEIRPGEFPVQARQQRAGQAHEVLPGRQQDRHHGLPAHRPAMTPAGAHPRLEQGRFPGVGKDGGMEEPQPAAPIDMQRGVAIGKPGGVPQGEARLPGTRPRPAAGGLDPHVIGLPFPGALEPGHEEGAIRSLDDAGGVVVAGLRREDRLGDQDRCRLPPHGPEGLQGRQRASQPDHRHPTSQEFQPRAPHASG